MKLKPIIKRLNDYISNILKFNRQPELKHSIKQSIYKDDEEATVATIFDGMGSVTATAIVKRRIDKHIVNQYGIKR